MDDIGREAEAEIREDGWRFAEIKWMQMCKGMSCDE